MKNLRPITLSLLLFVSALSGCAYTGYPAVYNQGYYPAPIQTGAYPGPAYPQTEYPATAYPVPAHPAPAYPASVYPGAPSSAPYQYGAHGVVDSIQRIDQAAAAPGIGAGTIIGGVVGGLLGNRIGGGNGKKIAIATGAVGGAIIGNQIERQNSTSLPMYQVNVRMDNGATTAFTQDSIAGFGIGSRVRIDNGRVYAYSAQIDYRRYPGY